MHCVDQVGTVPAALTAYLALLAFQPDLLISAGTAGGFKAQGGAVGDVYVGSSVMNHDRRIPIPVRACLTVRMCWMNLCSARRLYGAAQALQHQWQNAVLRNSRTP